MQTDRSNTIILSLSLLWLALSGGYAGWWNPYLLAINLCAWLGIMIWLGAKGPRPGPIHWGMVGVVASILLSAWVNGTWYAGLTQAAVWAGYMAIYALATTVSNHTTINRAAVLAFFVFLPLGLGGALWGVFNSNVVAFSLVGLAFLAWPVSWVPLASTVIFNVVWLNSMGAMLAVMGGGLVLIWAARRRWAVFAAVAAMVPLVSLDLLHGGEVSVQYRARFLSQAWANFAAAPLFGLGPGSYESFKYWHAHNIIATTAAELGLVGLLALAVLGWVVVKGWPTLPIWAAAILLAFAAWSMVDEPMRFWGPGAMAMLAMSRGHYV